MNLENFKTKELNLTQQREINGGGWIVWNSETRTITSFKTFAFARQYANFFGGKLRYVSVEPQSA